MNFKGIQKLTLLDYPGKVACTLFTGGCNFRCPFCHNATLVTRQDDIIDPEEEVLKFLKKRVGILDGVAITGGEPLLHREIVPFLGKVRELGYKIKLDTNGSRPELLREIVEAGLVDYVAVDIKNSRERYAETIGLREFDLTPIEETVSYLLTDPVEYEFRTTLVSGLHTVESVKKAAEWIRGTKKYYLQNFVDSGELIVPGMRGLSKAEMNDILAAVREIIPEAELRGI